jgi:hypothetical protein
MEFINTASKDDCDAVKFQLFKIEELKGGMRIGRIKNI